MDKFYSIPTKTHIWKFVTLDYIFSFLACLSFSSAFHALTPTLPIYLARLQIVEQEIGVLVGTVGIAALISRFFAAKILMRYSEKRIMICGAVLFTLTFLAYIVSRSFWPLFFIRLFQGIAFSFMDTALMAYIVRTVAPEYRTKAISYFFLGPPLASAIATSIGVFVFNKFGFSVLLMICSFLSVCAALFFLKLKKENPVEITSGFPAQNKLPYEAKIFVPAIIGFLGIFSWGGLTAFFPLFAVQCGITNPGYFFSVVAVMLVISRTLGGKVVDNYGKERVIAVCIMFMLISLILLSFSRTLLLFIIVGVIWGMGFGLLSPLSMAYSLEYAGSSNSTAVATFLAFLDLGIALGPVIAGIMVPFTGYPVMFLCLAFICTVNLFYFQFYLRRKDRTVVNREQA